MFGPGIPILFIIGFFAISTLYLVERYSLAYYNRAPPKFDSSLNKDIVRDLHWPPLLYSMLGFWMFSNRQLFENEVVFKEHRSETTRYNHKIIESLFRLSPGSPFIFVIFV